MTNTQRLTMILRDLGLEPFGKYRPGGQCMAVIAEWLPPDLTDYSIEDSVCYWPDIPWEGS